MTDDDCETTKPLFIYTKLQRCCPSHDALSTDSARRTAANRGAAERWTLAVWPWPAWITAVPRRPGMCLAGLRTPRRLLETWAGFSRKIQPCNHLRFCKILLYDWFSFRKLTARLILKNFIIIAKLLFLLNVAYEKHPAISIAMEENHAFNGISVDAHFLSRNAFGSKWHAHYEPTSSR